MNAPVKRLPFHDASQVAGVSHKDRLLTAGFFVLLLHGVIILGITFSAGNAKPTQGPTFAVTLVQSRIVKVPEHADYIAQANHIGHGNTRKRVRPSSPVSSPAPAKRAGALDAPNNRNRAAPTVKSSAAHLVTTTGETPHNAASEIAKTQANASPRFLIARLMTQQANSADPTARKKHKAQATDKNPRVRTISVNTRQSRFARYLNAWRKHVTRIGNLNYPAVVRSRHLSGHLSLEVALNSDGTLRDVTLVKPSKHAALNAAALAIVHSGAPYPPFPKSISKDTDVLRFIYEWRFINGQLRAGS